jgi:hypothetical protein
MDCGFLNPTTIQSEGARWKMLRITLRRQTRLDGGFVGVEG